MSDSVASTFLRVFILPNSHDNVPVSIYMCVCACVRVCVCEWGGVHVCACVCVLESLRLAKLTQQCVYINELCHTYK